MFRGEAYIHAILLPKNLGGKIAGYSLQHMVSFADALRGIRARLFTWATVKLYYSVFYCVRGILALDGFCLFYVGSKPYLVQALPGDPIRKTSGTTHKCIFDIFRKAYSGHELLSQQIDLTEPLCWLLIKREQANYRNAGFPEPEVPPFFKSADQIGIRRAIETYLADTNHFYTFDPDHAIFALPLRTLTLLRNKLVSLGKLSIDEKRARFVIGVMSDKKGRIAGLERLVH